MSNNSLTLKLILGFLSCLCSLSLTEPCDAQAPTAFHVTLSKQVATQPVTGRVFVFITANPQRSPMQGPNWFSPEPFAALEVKDLRPDGTVIVDDQADCFPLPISRWPRGQYRVQAVLDHDFYYPEPAVGPGNFFSQVVNWSPGSDAKVALTLDQVVPEIKYVDSERVKFVQRKSELLSKHFERDVIDRVAVILPKSYDTQPQRRYPVYYEVTGFGGDLRSMARGPRDRAGREDEAEFIQVMLTGECKYGHHVYANSATNGPRGDALVQEIIPHIDSTFRTIADPAVRFVGGHSSGGWSSLWLQVNYPEVFGGVFSTSPDPVDFRDFQGTDLYATPTQSVYVDASGNRRPLARRGEQVVLRYDDFCKMDQVLGRGGQMRSFDAVFSPLDAQGRPERCWDPATGVVRAEVVNYWKYYDISLILAENWPKLRESLTGKIHVAMGELDTFYLEGASHRLAERLKELGSDAQFEFIPGASHNLPGSVFQKNRQTMAQKFLKKYNADGSPR
jgi:S-formylglutathione hydrolase FrmB